MNTEANGWDLESVFGDTVADPPVWTCVRTRPRWEKKFARILDQRRERYFLPMVRHETISYRRRRVTDKLLIPGYVFLARNCEKREFKPHSVIVRLIRPACQGENRSLHEDLGRIWQGLVSGVYLRPAKDMARGEPCKIVDGVLRGVSGRFEKKGRRGCVVISVDMIGVGVAMDLPAEWVAPE